MPDASAKLAYLPTLNIKSVCDLNLSLLFSVIVLGGYAATLARVGWLYLRRKAAAYSKSIHQQMIREDGYVERDHPSV